MTDILIAASLSFISQLTCHPSLSLAPLIILPSLPSPTFLPFLLSFPYFRFLPPFSPNCPPLPLPFILNLFLASNSHTHSYISHLTIRYHIMYHFSDTIGKAGPVAWMVELFGPLDGSESFENDYFANAVNSLSNYRDGRKIGGCVHEDGGRFAVFQSTEGDAVRGREQITSSFIPSFHSISVTLISNISSHLSPSHFVFCFLFCFFCF